MNTFRSKRILVVAAASLGCLCASKGYAQSPDPRDYEIGYFVPGHATVINAYLRHQTGTENTNYSADVFSMRLTQMFKFGDFVFAPLDVVVPVVDQRVHTSLASTLEDVNQAFGALPRDLNLTLHETGLGDMLFLPTIGHGVTQNPENHTHTWYAITTYVRAPTGGYDPDRLLNVGANRWSFQPLVVVGQRFWRVVTLEAMGTIAWYTDNNEHRLPIPELAGQNLTLSQQPSKNAALHFAVDLHPTFYIGSSYLYANNGRQDVTVLTPTSRGLVAQTPSNSVHTLRINFGIRITPQTLMLVQWNEDLAGSATAPLGRFFGLRFSHAFFRTPKA